MVNAYFLDGFISAILLILFFLGLRKILQVMTWEIKGAMERKQNRYDRHVRTIADQAVDYFKQYEWIKFHNSAMVEIREQNQKGGEKYIQFRQEIWTKFNELRKSDGDRAMQLESLSTEIRKLTADCILLKEAKLKIINELEILHKKTNQRRRKWDSHCLQKLVLSPSWATTIKMCSRYKQP